MVILDRPERDLDLESVNRLKSVLEFYISKGRSFVINSEHPLLLELSNQSYEIKEDAQ